MQRPLLKRQAPYSWLHPAPSRGIERLSVDAWRLLWPGSVVKVRDVQVHGDREALHEQLGVTHTFGVLGATEPRGS